MFLSFGVYVAALAWLYWRVGIWTDSQIAATVLWCFLSGTSLLARSFDVKEGEKHFRKYVRDAISITGVIEFLYVAHTFSLITEIVLTPLVTCVGLLYAVSERDHKYTSVKKLTEWILFIVVIIFIWKSVSGIWESPEEFLKVSTARSFILPFAMTIGSIPFFYIMYCYSQVEIASIRINFKDFQSNELKRYAKRRFFRSFALRPWLLLRATRQFQSLPAEKNSDVDRIADEIERYEREAKNPPQVDERYGWSPYAAREFLSEKGLRTADYHETYSGGEWWASSEPLKLDDEILYSSVSYSIEGTDGLVRRLKLKVDFRRDTPHEAAIERFLRIAVTLLIRSETADSTHLRTKVTSGEAFEEKIGRNLVLLAKKPHPFGSGFDLAFEIGNETTG